MKAKYIVILLIAAFAYTTGTTQSAIADSLRQKIATVAEQQEKMELYIELAKQLLETSIDERHSCH